MGIQLFDPFIFLPITNVASINKIPPPYKIFAKAVKTLLSSNKMKIPMKVQKIATYICLLYLFLPPISELLKLPVEVYSTMNMQRMPIAIIVKYRMITAKSVPFEKLLGLGVFDIFWRERLFFLFFY